MVIACCAMTEEHIWGHACWLYIGQIVLLPRKLNFLAGLDPHIDDASVCFADKLQDLVSGILVSLSFEPSGTVRRQRAFQRMIPALPREEGTEDGEQRRVVFLSRCREKQAVRSREASDHLVLTVQRLSELETIAIALQPHRLSPVRPREQPLFLHPRGAQSEPIAIPDTIDDDVDLV